MTLRIKLSSVERSAVGTDVMTAWFAKGVGLVKYGAERLRLAEEAEFEEELYRPSWGGRLGAWIRDVF